MSYKKYRTALIMLFVFTITFFASCGNTLAKKESVKISSIIGVTNQYENLIEYNFPRSMVDEIIQAQPMDSFWEDAGDGLTIRYTSWLENEDPTVVQFRLVYSNSNQQNSFVWRMPNDITIGSTRVEVLEAFGLTDASPDGMIDLFYKEDSADTSMMYQLTQEEENSISPGDMVFRVAIEFEENKVSSIQMGTLESMG